MEINKNRKLHNDLLEKIKEICTKQNVICTFNEEMINAAGIFGLSYRLKFTRPNKESKYFYIQYKEEKEKIIVAFYANKFVEPTVDAYGIKIDYSQASKLVRVFNYDDNNETDWVSNYIITNF